MSTPRLLSNRYELGDTLGYGGMSEVHHGHDVRLGREVAIKILRADLARDPQFQERFRREAQNAAALNHPAIVAVYDTGETQTEYGPLPYIVMEFVSGRTLRDIVKTEGPMTQKRAMEVMADVCAALDFSHRHGIVHRDVKPANVMITANGAVKVMDFGIARAIHDGQAAMTQTAAVIGTAQYLSPEQARGESVDARSDVYAAGCVLYELITGEPPFTGDSPVAVAYQHVREDPNPPSSVNPAVSPELDAVVLKALAKGPANRYQSAAEMRSDMVRTLSGQNPLAPMVMSEDERTQVMNSRRPPAAYDDGYAGDGYDADAEDRARRSKRNKIFAALAVVGVLLVAGVMYFAGVFDEKKELVAIPAVQGQQEATAFEALRVAGLQPEKEPVICKAPQAGATSPCNSDQINKVVATNPQVGVEVAKGSVVKVQIGTAPQKVKVPDLVGKEQGPASDAAKEAGFEIDTNIEEVETKDPSEYGKVIEQNPRSGVEAEQGTAIKLTVGKRPNQVLAQSQVGKKFSEAKKALEELNLKVTRKDVTSEKPKDEVVAQNPVGGTVDEGTLITLEVSTGAKEQLSMPDVQGATLEQAKKALKEAGWSGQLVTLEDEVNDDDLDGRVTNTDPSGGSTITKDQTITLFVGKLNRPGGPSIPGLPGGS
ncbi:Stk1 family PASTA domain-containing Ser/Thr kinase [Amycolatopsis magusensis]|uniref:Stk1 family PASTA domain-containing Ser/Thr kinase n=1 Tax=Amycolatopsis magusensis TaxID=882444 RepID=UPI0024A96C49|nr:Stk1 family PASTA domain-containing Ser/Thr kinase [Amycolatopsis magusensis]MDI5980925.1 Stk1 family PASTA domain-containing Ser/Thr kinase [Amycolatopsis magusensis]